MPKAPRRRVNKANTASEQEDNLFWRLSSAAERERRLTALRAAMDAAGLSALVVCGRGDEFMRGRVQYVSDIFQWAGWGIVVLPRYGEAAFIADPLWGLGRARLVGWHADVRSSHSPGAEIAQVLADRGAAAGPVGVAGLADITTAAQMTAMREALPKVSFRDATDLFDDIRSVKSDEELDNLAETSAILRTVYRSLEAELRPGVMYRDVMAEAHRLVRQYGCLDGIAQIATRPFTALMWSSTKTLRRGDVIAIDLEWGGPSGYWVELRRNYSLGPPPDDVRRYWDTRMESYAACVAAMKAGNSSADILAARDRVYAKHGQDGRGLLSYTAHGIGVDSLEPPWVPGKERVLAENMVISLHPSIGLPDAEHAAFGCLAIADNVRVTATGGERMTYTDDAWIELDV
jgi:Xaa-Pro aminopeptidase